jgi:two-component system, OmpR family, sensor kinase
LKTGSLQARVVLVTMVVLTLVLAIVIAAVTVSYRASLTHDVRSRLAAASAAVERARTTDTVKGLTNGLALDGIATEVRRAPQPPQKPGGTVNAPAKTGSNVTSSGGTMHATVVLADGSEVVFTASQTAIDRTVGRLLAFELAIAVLALTLGALALLRATKMALRPLAEVASVAGAIAGGDRSLRLHPSRSDTELGALATAFDQMVDALEGAVTEARDAEAGMRIFVADASHELRTPVAALQASAESLLRDQPARPERDRQEAALARSAARLGRLVDDLLDMARLDAAEPPALEEIDLADVARDAVDRAALEGATSPIALEAQPAPVHGSRDELTRAARNLVDNAVAASPPGSVVRVAVVRIKGCVELRVGDEGPGVPPEQRERIFDRFVRLDPGGTPGSGLGLAIARRIARKHGGDVTYQAAPDGCSFVLQLPSAVHEISPTHP